jgi:hypothetical protein
MLKMFKKEGLIDDSFMKTIMKWRHVLGFNVHNEVKIKADARGQKETARDGKEKKEGEGETARTLRSSIYKTTAPNESPN